MGSLQLGGTGGSFWGRLAMLQIWHIRRAAKVLVLLRTFAIHDIQDLLLIILVTTIVIVVIVVVIIKIIIVIIIVIICHELALEALGKQGSADTAEHFRLSQLERRVSQRPYSHRASWRA